MMRFLREKKQCLWLFLYLVAALASFALGLHPGEEVFGNITQFFIEMVTFIPFLFIIDGLFDVWFPKEKVEKHIGQESGIKGILIVIVSAMRQAGSLYGAFPVAYVLHKKGAGIKNIFIYLGAFSSLKIPMVGMEIGYLGIQFTLARTLVSLPLFIAIGYFMEWYSKGAESKVNRT